MKNLFIAYSKPDLGEKVWNYIENLSKTVDNNVAVVDVDFNQKEKLILAKRNSINATLMNHVDLKLFSHFMKIELTKGKNLLEIILIEDISKLSKEEMKFFEKNLKELNRQNMYVIFCSSSKPESLFIKSNFVDVNI